MCLRRHSSAALCFSVSLLNLPSLSFPSCVICLALPFLLPPRSAVISVVVLFLVWLGSEKLSCFCPPSYFAGTDSALLELPSELLLWQQCPSTAAHAPRTKCISSCRCVNIHSNCRFFASTSSHTRRVRIMIRLQFAHVLLLAYALATADLATAQRLSTASAFAAKEDWVGYRLPCSKRCNIQRMETPFLSAPASGPCATMPRLPEDWRGGLLLFGKSFRVFRL